MEMILIILALLIFAGICFAVAKLMDYLGERSFGSKESWQEFEEAVNQNSERKKYNNYVLECPICHSKNVKKISTASRALSVGMVGMASSKIGKQYECDNCHHKW